MKRQSPPPPHSPPPPPPPQPPPAAPNHHGGGFSNASFTDSTSIDCLVPESGDSIQLEAWKQAEQKQNFVPNRQVHLRLVFTKIGDIDTVRECFEASVYLEARWREPSLNAGFGHPNGDGGDTTASSEALAVCWHPDLYIDNGIGEIASKCEREVVRDPAGEMCILERRSFRGKFFERMELWHFPFDTQDITVTVCSNLPESVIELCEMPDKSSRVFTSTFTDEQEWSLHTHVEGAPTTVISDSQIGPRQRPGLQFSTRATRRAMFYIVNIWLVSFILCMLALCIFGIDRHNLQGRLQLSFLLLLTTITFKSVIANHIPRVSYLTMLDKAVMHNLLFLVLLSIWHSVASLYPTEHPLQTSEKFAIIAFAGVYVLGVAIIWLQVVFGALRRKKLMDEKDRQYQRKVEELRKSRKIDSDSRAGNTCT